MRGLGQAGGGEEALHGVLVHGGGGAENARADVGDVGQLEEALDGSVLAEGAVQHGEDDVERGGERVAGLRKIGPGAAFEAVRGAPHRMRGWDVERLAATQDGGGGGELGVGFAWRTLSGAGAGPASRRWAWSPQSQRPCLSMAMGTTS